MKEKKLFPLLLAGLALLFYLFGAFEGAERASLALRLNLRGPRPPSSLIEVVAIDEASLARYGQFPWDRRLYALLLDKLAKDGASAVGFDIAFNEKGPRPGEDEIFALAMRERPVVLPLYRAFASGDGLDLQFPLPIYQKAARALGSAQFGPLQESPLLSFSPLQRQGEKIYPAFALALAKVGKKEVPSENFFLDPVGPARSFKMTPFREALGKPAGFFKEKFVLVGATAAGLPDTGYQSFFPAGGPISGVELQANALDNLLSRQGLKRIPWPGLSLLLLCLSFCWAPLLLNPRLQNPFRRTLWMLLIFFCLSFLGQVTLLWGLWLDLVPLLFLAATLFVFGLILEEAALLGDRNAWLEWYNVELQRESKRQRERIDGELHDEAQQLLVALIRDLRRFPKVLERSKEEVLGKLTEMEGIGSAVLDEIVRVRRDLTPHTLSRAGFLPAVEEMLQEAARRGDFEGELEVSSWDTLDQDLENELYWVLKECLNNTIKHSGAKKIHLLLEEKKDGQLSVAFRDDGQGFEVPDFTQPPVGTAHSGIHRLYMRISALGGTLRLSSRPGEGTTLFFLFPKKGRSK